MGSTPRPMRLFDTARRAVVDFAPGPVVSLYTCGITPYDATHLGHAAVFLTYDVLQRRLRDRGHETHCVRNITDVDDDILRAARKREMHYLDLGTAEIPALTTTWTRSACSKVERNHARHRPSPTSAASSGWCSPIASTRNITDMARVLRRVDLQRFRNLSRLDRNGMLEAGREHGEIPTTLTGDPLDFVLWRRSLPASRMGIAWGHGRPGWHIECSAPRCGSSDGPSTCTAVRGT